MKPRKPRIVEHELEQSTAPFDPSLFALVANACVLEQCLVNAKQASTNIVELLSGLLWQWPRGGWGRTRHWRVGRQMRGALLLIVIWWASGAPSRDRSLTPTHGHYPGSRRFATVQV